jgi:hypothetical protein
VTGASYRYQGDSGWDPTAGDGVQTPARRKSARAVEFARLREEGLTIAQASRAIGVVTATGYRYEQDRKEGAS